MTLDATVTQPLLASVHYDRRTTALMSSATSTPESTVTVRYQVSDIERSISFYTERLAFRLGTKVGSAFADVVRGNLRLILSGPGSSGARPMPDGQRQEPGGWNRIVLTVDDLASEIAVLLAMSPGSSPHVYVAYDWAWGSYVALGLSLLGVATAARFGGAVPAPTRVEPPPPPSLPRPSHTVH